jgi:hypothetical protein
MRGEALNKPNFPNVVMGRASKLKAAKPSHCLSNSSTTLSSAAPLDLLSASHALVSEGQILLYRRSKCVRVLLAANPKLNNLSPDSLISPNASVFKSILFKFGGM